jgi:AcrR family transcriptional regulator
MSPRSNLSNQKIRDERREQILHGALKVFAYKGFKATKISDIAAEVALASDWRSINFPKDFRI